MKKYLPYFLLALPFFFLKLTNIGIWLSDTNIYFYTGYQLLQGKILYKDIFFTNFPLFPYVSALYFFITNGNLPLFFFTSTIEVIITGFFIYKIIFDQEKNKMIALLASGIYLYSFIVLATSDHQSGVFLGGLFAVVSYFFFTKQKLFLSGLFIACALLTKAYFLPITLALFLTIFFTQTKKDSSVTIKQSSNWVHTQRARALIYFLSGSFLATIFVLLPSLLLAPHDLFRDVITYSLTRSQGIPKANIAGFFLTHDTTFVVLLFWNIVMIRKQLFFGLVSLLSLLFFFLYQDIYYLYLNFSIPFLALSFPAIYKTIQKTFSLQKMIIPTIMGIVLAINLSMYVSIFRTQQKIENIEDITQVITREHPKALYGVNALTPALAYLSDTPLLDGIIDTNENIFRKGFLNKELLTEHAINSEAILISSAAIYPGANVNYPLLGGIFDEKAVSKSCKLIGTFFVKPEGIENAINVFSCKKQLGDK